MEAVSLARDLTNHVAVRRALPFLVEDRTRCGCGMMGGPGEARGQRGSAAHASLPPAAAPLHACSLLGGSSVVLSDGKQQLAVVACTYVPPATSGKALESRLEVARLLAEARAEQLRASASAGTDRHIAVGVVSNAAGLEWYLPPVGLPQLLPPLEGAARKHSAPAGCSAGTFWRWLLAVTALACACFTAATAA